MCAWLIEPTTGRLPLTIQIPTFVLNTSLGFVFLLPASLHHQTELGSKNFMLLQHVLGKRGKKLHFYNVIQYTCLSMLVHHMIKYSTSSIYSYFDDSQGMWIDANLILLALSNTNPSNCVCRVLIRKDAKVMRDHHLFDYFRQCFPSDLNIVTYKELAHALASLPPYEVPLSRLKVMHLHCQVS